MIIRSWKDGRWPVSYAEAPHVVTWEITRACQLHCRHCRASAIRHRNPEELRFEESLSVLDDLVQGFHRPPILVLTGGDPLERPDLDDLIRAAVERRLVTAVAPSVTPRLSEAVVARWADIGVHAVSLSLDGVDAATHDGFRGVRGTFDRTLQMAAAVRDAGLSLQINSSVARQTVHQLRAMARLVDDLGVASWEIFFVIPTGRARVLDALDAAGIEEALAWLADYRPSRPFRITAVGAPQWVRVRHQRTPAASLPPAAAREARGFAFIDHRGEVYPSGYLPVTAGNVRERPLSQIYRESVLFTSLRDPAQLDDACGACAYAELCGGSRARAYAMTGNLYAADPGCVRVGWPTEGMSPASGLHG